MTLHLAQESDAFARVAMLRACRRPLSTDALREAVEDATDLQWTNRQVGTMAARLHRAGWLTYVYPVGYSEHLRTSAGDDVLALIVGDRR